MREKFCLSTLQDSLKEELVKAGLKRADVGVMKNGPIITVAIGFDPRILRQEFYRNERFVEMRLDIDSFSHRSASLASDFGEFEVGIVQVLVNTIPDYCTEKRVLKAISSAISMISEGRKDLLNDEDNTPMLDQIKFNYHLHKD